MSGLRVFCKLQVLSFVIRRESCENRNTFFGGNSEEATPVPIPNTEVKLFSADGTATVAWWESRSPPNLILKARIIFWIRAFFVALYFTAKNYVPKMWLYGKAGSWTGLNPLCREIIGPFGVLSPLSGIRPGLSYDPGDWPAPCHPYRSRG